MKFSNITKAVAGGVALSAILTGAALAEPAVIYDLGGKFDKSFNEAAFNGAQRWAAPNCAEPVTQAEIRRDDRLVIGLCCRWRVGRCRAEMRW